MKKLRGVDELKASEIDEIEKSCKKVIENWVNIKNDKDQDFTALHYAAYLGNAKTIHFLMDHFADPSVKSSKGLSVLHLAA